MNNIDASSEASEKEVLDRFNIQEDTFYRIIDYYHNQQDPRVHEIQKLFSETQIKENEPRNLSLEEFKKALIRKTELFESESINLPTVRKMLNNPDFAGTIIHYRVLDMLSAELGVEDEDFALATYVHFDEVEVQDPEAFENYRKAKGKAGL